ncbi:hypothetical protein ZIOFF_043863 [Zingiber officinale]|uniref:Uncharacterized protein n=1 Tax=Zingiber officinale TaxID=94328 RepID=A0A8J5KZ89_ZINOF|nr:hypothetical protein ZIOFF_043863 [Zingiber officinale]
MTSIWTARGEKKSERNLPANGCESSEDCEEGDLLAGGKPVYGDHLQLVALIEPSQFSVRENIADSDRSHLSLRSSGAALTNCRIALSFDPLRDEAESARGPPWHSSAVLPPKEMGKIELEQYPTGIQLNFHLLSRNPSLGYLAVLLHPKVLCEVLDARCGFRELAVALEERSEKALTTVGVKGGDKWRKRKRGKKRALKGNRDGGVQISMEKEEMRKSLCNEAIQRRRDFEMEG